MNLIITIDGPAASGKGTLARLLSESLNLLWIDTGLFYRAVALEILSQQLDPSPKNAAHIASQITAPVIPSSQLRETEVSKIASCIATFPELRSALLPIQQYLANNPPQPYKGAVLDGRDTGSVVCPHAHAKFYLNASIEERAKRRALEQNTPETQDQEHVKKDLQQRDLQDSQRSHAPLVIPQNATVIDSSALSPEKTLEICLETLVRMGIMPS